MIEQLTQNWLCWVIVVLAFFCYQQLWHDLFFQGTKTDNMQNPSAKQSEQQQEFISVLIGALPLLGLLGTIVGLLDCFAGMSTEGASSELVSKGIGDALLTTQLGLACAIPAWLLHSYGRAAWQRKFSNAQRLIG